MIVERSSKVYTVPKSLRSLEEASLEGISRKDYRQAGRSVAGIVAVEPAGEIVRRFA